MRSPNCDFGGASPYPYLFFLFLKATRALCKPFSIQKMSLTSQVMVEAYRRDASSKDQLINELKSTKKRLLAEVKDLKQEVLGAQGEKQKAELEQARLQKEVARVQEQITNMEAHLQAIQTERDQLETQIQVL